LQLNAKGGAMSLQARLESLRGRHAALETQIAEEDRRPKPDELSLARLKREKLRLKEEIEELQTRHVRN
jgi:hypothetical protein